MGLFKVRITSCLFCSKLKEIVSSLEDDNLIFYNSDEKKTIYLKFPISNLVGVMKRQITAKDVNMLSLFYVENIETYDKFAKMQGNIKELKLKCNSSLELRDWLIRFRNKINFKVGIYRNAELDSEYVSKYSVKEFQTELRMLEYIIKDHRPHLKLKFFENLKNLAAKKIPERISPELIYVDRNVLKTNKNYDSFPGDESTPLNLSLKSCINDTERNYEKLETQQKMKNENTAAAVDES